MRSSKQTNIQYVCNCCTHIHGQINVEVVFFAHYSSRVGVNMYGANPGGHFRQNLLKVVPLVRLRPVTTWGNGLDLYAPWALPFSSRYRESRPEHHSATVELEHDT